MNNLYYDCAPSNGIVTSFYTSHGIKCIDSEYVHRIMNIRRTVKRIIQIDRRHHYESKDGGYRSNYWDDYTEIPLDKDYRVFDHAAFIYDDYDPFVMSKITVELERLKSLNLPYQEKILIAKSYSFTKPIYSHIHKGEDPEVLRKEIKTNPHLHKDIKKNLLGNLKTYLTLDNERNINKF